MLKKTKKLLFLDTFNDNFSFGGIHIKIPGHTGNVYDTKESEVWVGILGILGNF
jgi:hypothetical protein